jgi:uncharacterized membrane protein YbhN (UPF0104 family)
MIPVSEKKSFGRRKSYFFFARLLLTLGMLAIIVLRVDLRSIGSAFQSMNGRTVLFAVALLPANLLLQMYRWHFILKTANISATTSDVAKSILVGLTFGLITPGRIGEVGRALYIRYPGTISIAGLILLEKVFSLFTVLITSAVSLILWGNEIAGILLMASTLFVVLHLSLIRSILSRLSFLLPHGHTVAELWTRWSAFDRKKIGCLLIISLLFFGIIYTQLYTLVSSFQRIEIVPALISIPLIIAVNSIPITIAGLGLREGAAVFFFSRFGVAEASALNGALLLFALDLLIPGLIGLGFIPKGRKRGRVSDQNANRP